jgi:NDP-sugar pyrophosphorylase family protein
MPSQPPDALILCGGQGVRLREVTGDAPKSLAGIAGRPFLELLLHQLRRHGFERAILAIGYQGEVIRGLLGDEVFGLRIEYSPEFAPLGTGGAIGNAVALIRSNACLVMNGDSYTDADLEDFVKRHIETGADASLLALPSDGRTDIGSIFCDEDGKLTAFEEKSNSTAPRHINAGIYLISRDLLLEIQRMPEIQASRAVSLERMLFPRWISEGKHIRVVTTTAACIDIGTPERYRGAQESLRNVERNSNS